MNIKNILNSGGVVRFHQQVGVTKQQNSEHQWGVALIVQHLNPDCSKDLLLAALTHDAAESYTGDSPFPVKKDHPELSVILRKLEVQWEKENDINFDLSYEEKATLKLADSLEGMWYCLQRYKCGEKNALTPFNAWRKFICGNLNMSSTYLYQSLIQEMEELRNGS
jgi:5'-deoxynucleotidase YfbR-like HD superfamily hydrolase